MATHYAATGTRTLCGLTLGQRLKMAPLWPDFLELYRTDPEQCCSSCIKRAKGWQRFARDLASVRRSSGTATESPGA